MTFRPLLLVFSLGVAVTAAAQAPAPAAAPPAAANAAAPAPRMVSDSPPSQADPRVCLEFQTRLEIITCANKYLPEAGCRQGVIDRLDHLVLTVRDVAATCDFYSRVLGMRVVTFGEGRRPSRFGAQKINLHDAGREFEPKAAAPDPGLRRPVPHHGGAAGEVVRRICGPAASRSIEGPVERTGAVGPDPLGVLPRSRQNLIEVSTYGEA